MPSGLPLKTGFGLGFTFDFLEGGGGWRGR